MRGGKLRCEQCYLDELARDRERKKQKKPTRPPVYREEAFPASALARIEHLQELASAWNTNTTAWEKREAAEALAKLLASKS